MPEPRPRPEDALSVSALVHAPAVPVKGIVVAGAAAGNVPAIARGDAALMPVANAPIVAHVIAELTAAGVDEVAVLAAPSAVEQLRPLGVELLVADTDDPHAWLGAAVDFVGGDACILHAADGLLSGSLAPLLSDLGSDGEPTVVLAYSPRADAPAPRIEHRRLLRLAGAGDAAIESAVAGVHVFRPGAFARAAERVVTGGIGTDPLDLAGALAHDGRGVAVRTVDGWQRYGGEAGDLLGLNRLVLDRLVPGPLPEHGQDSVFQGRVFVHPTARIESTLIRGPVIVGPHAVVTDAYLGPYTAIGAGVRVEGAEIEHSIILDGATLLHLGRRLEASVVGRNARVFRDFSLPRALRLNVGDNVEVALC